MGLQPLYDPLKRLWDYIVIQPSYVILKIGDRYYAKNGETGEIEFSGTDAATVIQSAIDALTSGRTWYETVVLKDSFELTDSIKLPNYTILNLRQAYLKLADNVNKPVITNASVDEDYTVENHHLMIIGGIIDGNKANQTANTYGDTLYVANPISPYGEVTRAGIGFKYVSDVAILDTEVLNCAGDGICLHGGYHVNKITYRGIVANVIARENVGHGVRSTMTIRGINFANIRAYSNGQAGLFMDSSQNRYDGIISCWNEYGIAGFSFHGCELRNALSLGSKSHGVYFVNTDTTYIRNSVISLISLDETKHGVYLSKNVELCKFDLLIKSPSQEGEGLYDAVRLGTNVNKNFIRVLLTLRGGANWIVYMSDDIDWNHVIVDCHDYPVTGIVRLPTEISNNLVEIEHTVTPKGTRKTDVATFSGDGVATEFVITSHGLVKNPTDPSRILAYVTPASADAVAACPVTIYPSDEDADGAYEALRVKFASAPAAGTDNVKVRWRTELY